MHWNILDDVRASLAMVFLFEAVHDVAAWTLLGHKHGFAIEDVAALSAEFYLPLTEVFQALEEASGNVEDVRETLQQAAASRLVDDSLDYYSR
ncbi:hypothetical protein 18_00141 [Pseudomonas phage Epa18]|uniref:Uncharacterized protein n=6 Tax=Nankokuvirus TaxID=1925779 RepID=A0A218L455_9CAUD|nr:hypothetical protein [Pseudomonas aeruginosa]YP_009206104.1 hypothetical protein AVT15_gp062 [Pseudomonas phage vB_PaeM_PS24]YP_009604769.1 hypothetical protein FDH93_gp142 [Pseudomonas phage vB_PaeM_G1]QIQ63911.1 hypothetical protein Epa24_00138 [Pseudomonas phage Epa24]QIQ64164.1 hypothetical protein Epa17_00019 [Pseudomonas phage Epa17]QIQ65058.1 hypothetical protein 16_00101 [Pseudomonas phage Epa16]QIQ65213.1 hypothetical protein 18_00141 [Pseudomonas phage Epa18]QIQ65691.1 hypotheti